MTALCAPRIGRKQPNTQQRPLSEPLSLHFPAFSKPPSQIFLPPVLLLIKLLCDLALGLHLLGATRGRSVTDSIMAAHGGESLVKGPLDGFLDGLVEYERQEWDSGESELEVFLLDTSSETREHRREMTHADRSPRSDGLIAGGFQGST